MPAPLESILRSAVAVFGGAFDPPHLGHREAVRGLFRVPGVRRAIVVPTGASRAKTFRAAADHRLAMARINFSSQRSDPAFPPEVIVDDREIRQAARTGQPSFTFDLLSELRREHGEIAFVVGTDQLRDLPRWHRFPEVLSLAYWIVLARQGEIDPRRVLQEGSLGSLASPLRERFAIVPTEALALSSTAIRENLARTGQPPAGSLLPEVDEYLKANGL